MAEHADGSIIVDTEIDSSGFKSGSAEMKSAVKSLTKQVSGLGPSLQKAMSGNTKAMDTFEAKAAALEAKIAELEGNMARLGTARLPTADYKYFTIELDKAKAKLEQLEAREAKMGATGVKQKSQAYKALQYDIQLTKEKILDLEATMAGMLQNGTAYQMGSATPEYQQMEMALAAAKQQLAEMDAAVSSVKANAAALPTIGQRIAAAFAKVGSIVKTGVVSGIKLAAKGAKALLSYTIKAVAGMAKLGRSSKRTGSSFGMMIKSMLFFTAFSAVLKSLKEGIDALAKSSKSFNNTMSELKTSTAKLRNSLITAFAPILSVVVPILSILINRLADAINLIGQFFAALTGATSYTKAITQQQDYAESLDKTASAAKEAKRQLAGFDELDVLSNTSGGGGASEDLGVTFDEVPIEVRVADFVARIKEAFANGEYAEIGKIVADGLNGIVQKVYDVLTSVDWEGIGIAFGDGLNGFVNGVDWDLVGKTIGAYFGAQLDVINGAITTFDWAAAGNALGTAAMAMCSSIDWSKAGSTLSTGVIGVLNFISAGIKAINWQQIGNDVASFIGGIDWSGMVTALFDGIGAALGGLASFLWGLVEGAWDEMVQWWYDTAYEDGEFIPEGLLTGIVDALANIGQWIVDNIFTPFINGFKEAFEINSPSKVMEEQGGFIVSGLLLGITSAWDGVTRFFTTGLNNINNTVRTGWTTIKSNTVSIWNQAKDGLSTTWENIKTKASNACSNVKTTVSDAWENVKKNVTDKLNTAKNNLSTHWDNIKKKCSETSDTIKSTLSTKWQSIADTLSTKASNIKKTISDKFTEIKNSASTWGQHICENLANGMEKYKSKVTTAAKGLAQKIKDFLGFSEPDEGPLSNFHTYMPDMVDLMVKGMNENAGRAGAAAAGIAQAISDEVQNGDYATAEVIPTAYLNSNMVNFSDKIVDSFTELMSRLQSIANGVAFTVPDVALGVAPYGVAAAANAAGRDDNGSGTDDDISSVVIQSVNNATVAIVKAIQDYSQTNVNIDADSLTDSIINEINRRTRMLGKSPLLT